MTYLMSIVAAVIVWDLIYQYYIHNRIEQLIKQIKELNDIVESNDDETNHNINCLHDRYVDLHFLTNAMNDDLKDIRNSEQRRQLHEEYKILADRYKKLAKEYEP